MISHELLTGFINDCLENSNKFLVEVIIQPKNMIQVFIDGDTGITINDCRVLSRQIEQRLDKGKEDFELTVSSAGIDRPLKLYRQYIKNRGRKITVKTTMGQIITGILASTGESGIELEHPVKNPKKEKQKENTKLTFNEIKSATIEVDFRK